MMHIGANLVILAQKRDELLCGKARLFATLERFIAQMTMKIKGNQHHLQLGFGRSHDTQ